MGSEMHLFKKGFSFAVDGPGNRLVYHMRGCNFRCPWCANPECFLPPEGPGTPVADILKEAAQAKPLYIAGGGVTFTGGEPTCQFGALREALEGLRALGVHACVESNASHPRLPELFPLTNLLILDCKHHDGALHRAWTGQGNEQVLANIRAAAGAKADLLVRIPLVGGVNASEADAAAFAALLRDLGEFPAEVLRYHEFGKPKWARQGMPYAMRDAQVSPAQAQRFEELLAAPAAGTRGAGRPRCGCSRSCPGG
ncbi:MAG: radical SAM protein [Oscillospiraceae bacterium]|jgi:pyruvate formate lyase activating enzyme|nr:radical SAM protein [Oscillospiraceae bacterium]